MDFFFRKGRILLKLATKIIIGLIRRHCAEPYVAGPVLEA